MKVRISSEDILKYLEIDPSEFPKYAAPIINLANRYAQGSWPRVVG
jgi:hypothetical protein